MTLPVVIGGDAPQHSETSPTSIAARSSLHRRARARSPRLSATMSNRYMHVLYLARFERRNLERSPNTNPRRHTGRPTVTTEPDLNRRGRMADNGSTVPASQHLTNTEQHLRRCKAFLRRRLATGPPLPDSAAGDKAGESLERWWPVGRREQCEELRTVRSLSRGQTCCKRCK